MERLFRRLVLYFFFTLYVALPFIAAYVIWRAQISMGSGFMVAATAVVGSILSMFAAMATLSMIQKT